MNRTLRTGLRARLLPLLATLSIAACAVNPATGKRQLSLVGTGQEIELGREYDVQMVAELGLYPDSSWQEYMQAMGGRMAALSERPDLPWTFRVVDDPIVNAFAVPGGFIYITRGILAHFNSEAELAAVLGHEIGHITARHSVSQMSRGMLAQLGLGAVTVLKPEAEGLTDLAGAGLGLLFLKYGRDDERQADDLGFRYMNAAGYDATQMIDVFEMLGRISGGNEGAGPPAWLSTHPAPEDRRERTERLLAANPAPDGATIGRESFIRRLDGLVYGEDPRQGFFEGSRFLHPDLAFQLDFPEGWKTVNQRQAILALSPEEDALIQLSVVPEARDAQTAARAFIDGSGIETTAPASATFHGLHATVFDFAAMAEGGELHGHAAFVAYGGKVFQLLGYAPASAWPQRLGPVETTFASFRALTDPKALGVQPRRIRVLELDTPTDLATLTRTHDLAVSAEELALLNGVEVGTRLPAGRLVKIVE